MQILGLALGVTQLSALGTAKLYQHVGIFWRYLTPSPNTSSFCVAVEYRLYTLVDISVAIYGTFLSTIHQIKGIKYMIE